MYVCYYKRMKKYKEPERLKGIGRRLALALDHLELSAVDFGRGAKFSEQQVSNWINGVTRPGLDAGMAMEEIYGIPMAWLYLGKQTKFSINIEKLASSSPTDNLAI